MNPPCPWLPAVDGLLDHSVTRRHGVDRGQAFFEDALRYAQSQWIAGKPAQAVLQIDRAWAADLPHGPGTSMEFPLYRALVWILARASAGGHGFLGDPVRHFQHLASRMSGPRAVARSWRAWSAMHVAERVLPRIGFSRDGRQLAREGLWIPSAVAAFSGLARTGWPGEAEEAAAVWQATG